MTPGKEPVATFRYSYGRGFLGPVPFSIVDVFGIDSKLAGQNPGWGPPVLGTGPLTLK